MPLWGVVKEKHLLEIIRTVSLLTQFLSVVKMMGTQIPRHCVLSSTCNSKFFLCKSIVNIQEYQPTYCTKKWREKINISKRNLWLLLSKLLAVINCLFYENVIFHHYFSKHPYLQKLSPYFIYKIMKNRKAKNVNNTNSFNNFTQIWYLYYILPFLRTFWILIKLSSENEGFMYLLARIDYVNEC